MKKIILTAVVSMFLGSSVTALASTDLVGTEIKAVFAKFNLEINGHTKELETMPLVYNGTSYLPVREIANLVGYDVTYKADSRTIALSNVTSATYTLKILPPVPTPVPTPAPMINEGTVFTMPANTVFNMDEWVSIKELSKQPSFKIMEMDDKLILKNDVATLSFPVGINSKQSKIPLFITSAGGQALLINNSEIFLKKESLKIFGIIQTVQ